MTPELWSPWGLLTPRGQDTKPTRGTGRHGWSPDTGEAWGRVCTSALGAPASQRLGNPPLLEPQTPRQVTPEGTTAHPPRCHALLELSRTDLLRAIRGVFVSCLCPCIKHNLPKGSLGAPGAVPGPQVSREAGCKWLSPDPLGKGVPPSSLPRWTLFPGERSGARSLPSNSGGVEMVARAPSAGPRQGGGERGNAGALPAEYGAGKPGTWCSARVQPQHCSRTQTCCAPRRTADPTPGGTLLMQTPAFSP